MARLNITGSLILFHRRFLAVRGHFMYFSLKHISILLFLTSFLLAQFTTDPGAGKPTVAILDFEARGCQCPGSPDIIRAYAHGDRQYKCRTPY